MSFARADTVSWFLSLFFSSNGCHKIQYQHGLGDAFLYKGGFLMESVPALTKQSAKAADSHLRYLVMLKH
jgi:hypothetical protein